MKLWFCITCRKEVDTGRSVPDILIGLIHGGMKLSPLGIPLCPECGNECVQVDDYQDPDADD